MVTNNIFELASRSKFRFNFRGVMTTEDLWDLPVETLDLIFKSLNAQVRDRQGESLLDTHSAVEDELEAKIDIVRHIVTVKLAERDARLRAKEKREQKQRIMEIISQKQDESLRTKSIEELSKMVDEL